MKKNIIINHLDQEIRVAILEGSRLTEIHYERRKDRSPVGNIYKGKVLKVLPGMEAAFVDIGLAKAAFLHVGDIRSDEATEDEKEVETPASIIPDAGDEAIEAAKTLLRGEEDQRKRPGRQNSRRKKGRSPNNRSRTSQSGREEKSDSERNKADDPMKMEIRPEKLDEVKTESTPPGDVQSKQKDTGHGSGNSHKAEALLPTVTLTVSATEGNGEKIDSPEPPPLPLRNTKHLHYTQRPQENNKVSGDESQTGKPYVSNPYFNEYEVPTPVEKNTTSVSESRTETGTESETETVESKSSLLSPGAEDRVETTIGNSRQKDGITFRTKKIDRSNGNIDVKTPPRGADTVEETENEIDDNIGNRIQDAPPERGTRRGSSRQSSRDQRDRNRSNDNRENGRTTRETSSRRSSETGARKSSESDRTDREPRKNTETDPQKREAGTERSGRGRGGQSRTGSRQKDSGENRQDRNSGRNRLSRGESRSEELEPAQGLTQNNGGEEELENITKSLGQNLKINELLKEGQSIMVQVIKGPISSKGARITTNISIPGRNFVMMPYYNDVAISKQITNHKERARLRNLLRKNKSEDLGFIIRTIAQRKPEEELLPDLAYLTDQWTKITQGFETKKGPKLIHEELNLTERVMREVLNHEVNSIIIDNVEEYEILKTHLEKYLPFYTDKLILHKGDDSIFDANNVNIEIDRALSRKVSLKSGGYLIIDQAEALTAIDINTGSYTGKTSHEDTILRTNLEATHELAHQIKLRDLGGIIIIDYIDMDSEVHRQTVHEALKHELKKDKARNKILGISELGLVEMTRKRSKESLNQFLCMTCPFCTGSGQIRSPETMAYDILRDLQEKLRQSKLRKDLVIVTNPDIGFQLEHYATDDLKKMEESFSAKIYVRSSRQYLPEQYEFLEL